MAAWPPSVVADPSTTSPTPSGSGSSARPEQQSGAALHALFNNNSSQAVASTAASRASQQIGLPSSFASSLSTTVFAAAPPSASSSAESVPTPSLITSPWNTTNSSSAAYSNRPMTTEARQSPDIGAFYGQTRSPDSSHDYGNGTSGTGASGAHASPRLFSSSSMSRSQRHIGAQGELNDDEKLFHQRDEMLLPRRNHTIASGAVDYRKRLERHFQQQHSQQMPSQQQQQHSTPLTSPTKNSLSAITGGKEEADDDWEAMIKRKESLIPTGTYDEDAREELNTAPWRPMPSVSSGHRRFPSQPTTTFGTSPVDSASPSISTSGGTAKGTMHQRSESAQTNRGLNEGPFASSPIIHGTAFGTSAGLVRRHQSLNYHTGRHVVNQLGKQGHQEQQQSHTRSGIVSPTLSMTQSSEYDTPGMSQAPAHRANVSPPTHSPIGSGNLPFSDRVSGFNGRHQQTTGTVDGFNSGGPLHAEVGHPSSATQLSSSLMDAHAQLLRMSLHPSSDVQSGASSDSVTSVSPPDPRLRKLPSLITNRDVLARGVSAGTHHHGLPGVGEGPVSASAYVPPIGHGHHRHTTSGSGAMSFAQAGDTGDHRAASSEQAEPNASFLRGPQSAFPAPYGVRRGGEYESGGAGNGDQNFSHAEHTHRIAGARNSGESGGVWPTDADEASRAAGHHMTAMMNANRHYQPDIMRFSNPGLRMGEPSSFTSHAPQRAAVANSTTAVPAFWMPSGSVGTDPPFAQTGSDAANVAAVSSMLGFGPLAGHATAPFSSSVAQAAQRAGGEVGFDPAVSALIVAKGYNPPLSHFNVNPAKARFFVIKSFTEDDVQRSLKHEIWASTEKGNQRLDRAFQESSVEGPLYLLFSVNASGHFCGVAQMLTPLDYSSDSNVWAQEGKWKGSFKVRWIYVKDVPNNRLRHIRLTNTPECKPITQSRDTQELPADGGRQALKIIAEFPSRTTLLQDWLFYEQQRPPVQEHRPPMAVGNGGTHHAATSDTHTARARQHHAVRSPPEPVTR